jgi:hypothetical protein
MKNVLFEEKRTESLNKWHFVKNKTEIMQRSPFTGLEWPRGFQEVKVPRLHDNGIEGW